MKPEVKSGEPLVHAVDCMIRRDWGGADVALMGGSGPLAEGLTRLMTELKDCERERATAAAHLRHEIGNALSIALANIEGMIDGVLDLTPERLEGIHQALSGIGAHLDGWRRAP